MSTEEIPRKRNYFVDEDSSEAGVLWDHFVTALHVWSWMCDGDQATVRVAATEFQVTDDVIHAAVNEYPWMFIDGPDDDATKQLIGHDGE